MNLVYVNMNIYKILVSEHQQWKKENDFKNCDKRETRKERIKRKHQEKQKLKSTQQEKRKDS